MIVLAANSLSSCECGQGITFEVTGASRGSKSSASKTVTKTIWSCSVEAVLEYCRIVFDLFPDQCQMCVAAVDEAKCQPVNSWRDEDQEIVKVRSQECPEGVSVTTVAAVHSCKGLMYIGKAFRNKTLVTACIYCNIVFFISYLST